MCPVLGGATTTRGAELVLATGAPAAWLRVQTLSLLVVLVAAALELLLTAFTALAELTQDSAYITNQVS